MWGINGVRALHTHGSRDMSHLQVVVPQGVQRDLQAPRAVLACVGGADQDDEGGFCLAVRSVLPVEVQAGEHERDEQRDGDEQDLRVDMHYHRMLRGVMGGPL